MPDLAAIHLGSEWPGAVASLYSPRPTEGLCGGNDYHRISCAMSRAHHHRAGTQEPVM